LNALPRRERERLARRDEIVVAAEREFLKNGFEKASMDKIAAEAQFTKRTLYKYFSSKEDLFWVVVAGINRRLLEYYKDSMTNEPDFFLKLRAIATGYLKFAQQNADAFRLLNESHFYRIDKDISPNYKDVVEIRNQGLQGIMELIKAGQETNTIRPDLDPQKTAFSLAFLLMGFLYMVFEGNKVHNNVRLIDQTELINYSLDLLYSAIKK